MTGASGTNAERNLMGRVAGEGGDRARRGDDAPGGWFALDSGAGAHGVERLGAPDPGAAADRGFIRDVADFVLGMGAAGVTADRVVLREEAWNDGIELFFGVAALRPGAVAAEGLVLTAAELGYLARAKPSALPPLCAELRLPTSPEAVAAGAASLLARGLAVEQGEELVLRDETAAVLAALESADRVTAMLAEDALAYAITGPRVHLALLALGRARFAVRLLDRATPVGQQARLFLERHLGAAEREAGRAAEREAERAADWFDAGRTRGFGVGRAGGQQGGGAQVGVRQAVVRQAGGHPPGGSRAGGYQSDGQSSGGSRAGGYQPDGQQPGAHQSDGHQPGASRAGGRQSDASQPAATAPSPARRAEAAPAVPPPDLAPSASAPPTATPLTAPPLIRSLGPATQPPIAFPASPLPTRTPGGQPLAARKPQVAGVATAPSVPNAPPGAPLPVRPQASAAQPPATTAPAPNPLPVRPQPPAGQPPTGQSPASQSPAGQSPAGSRPAAADQPPANDQPPTAHPRAATRATTPPRTKGRAAVLVRTRTATGAGSIGIAVDEDGAWATSLGGAGRDDAASGLAELFGTASFGTAPCS
ncbi:MULTISPECIES: hypothetical protein [Actinosynnema]|uniref:hypothetical protein n=1 Tax=Actinosynnema TaxID=40566 RepID=UPI0020A38C84|nr:hypothetical protein [Actinosynnema pretiosum]MCP2095664.1 hypothetical protein [Actinosynnema pretiosum]